MCAFSYRRIYTQSYCHRAVNRKFYVAFQWDFFPWDQRNYSQAGSLIKRLKERIQSWRGLSDRQNLRVLLGGVWRAKTAHMTKKKEFFEAKTLLSGRYEIDQAFIKVVTYIIKINCVPVHGIQSFSR